ncbi:response regulator [Pyxidicoccus fallax]|uniref:Response regulator n=1 Tax=Pyxidicoccus fallax TaxID=394095 RepID=A0A848L7F9_9BACT|nr:response regulator [Pyxidicoccus fallax]NPC83680.1 response regulator [Pyxidicoccus fallax]
MVPARILLVDDEESLRITLAANLELEGHTVLEAASAEDALKVLSEHSVDVVLTDIRMPGLHGVDLLRRIKQDRPDMPVVLMTAFTAEELVDDALAEGAFTVLPKPFDVAHALDTILRAVRAPQILVVDDTEKVAQAMVRALSTVGLRAKAVYSGEEALSSLRSGSYDVCVLDLVMPEMSGPELVTKVREADLSVAVIAMSGHVVPEMLRRVAAQGAVVCMTKPVPLRELVQAIARVRGQPRGPAGARN